MENWIFPLFTISKRTFKFYYLCSSNKIYLCQLKASQPRKRHTVIQWCCTLEARTNRKSWYTMTRACCTRNVFCETCKGREAAVWRTWFLCMQKGTVLSTTGEGNYKLVIMGTDGTFHCILYTLGFYLFFFLCYVSNALSLLIFQVKDFLSLWVYSVTTKNLNQRVANSWEELQSTWHYSEGQCLPACWGWG